MIIDFHTHVFSPDVRENRDKYVACDYWFAQLYQNPKATCASDDELIAAMDEAGVDRAVLCGFGWGSLELCREQNDYVLDCLRRHPSRLIGFAAVQPRAGEAGVAELERCVKAGMRGIGEVCPDGQGWQLDDQSNAGPLAEAAIALGVPLLVHTTEPVGHEYHGKGSVTLPALYSLMSRYPDLRLVCGHWGGGFPFYELMAEVARAAKNVRYDTAASLFLYRDAIFRVALDIVGQHKIVFGSDYPLIKQSQFLSRVRNLGLPEDALADILGNNAARLVGLLPSEDGATPADAAKTSGAG